MGSWGVGVFESDDASDYIVDVIDSYVEEIDELLDQFDVKDGWFENETPFLVVVTLVETICKSTGASPPKPKYIENWSSTYHAALERFGLQGAPGSEWIEARKEVASKCFSGLLDLSTEY